MTQAASRRRTARKRGGTPSTFVSLARPLRVRPGVHENTAHVPRATANPHKRKTKEKCVLRRRVREITSLPRGGRRHFIFFLSYRTGASPVRRC